MPKDHFARFDDQLPLQLGAKVTPRVPFSDRPMECFGGLTPRQQHAKTQPVAWALDQRVQDTDRVHPSAPDNVQSRTIRFRRWMPGPPQRISDEASATLDYMDRPRVIIDPAALAEGFDVMPGKVWKMAVDPAPGGDGTVVVSRVTSDDSWDSWDSREAVRALLQSVRPQV